MVIARIEARKKTIWERYARSCAFAPPPFEIHRAKAQVLEEVCNEIRGEFAPDAMGSVDNAG